MAKKQKPTLATVWLDGCSGCHMSFLDIDEALITLAEKASLVYSPLVDNKEFPKMVDVTLIEGAVSTDEDVAKLRKVRSHTKTLVALGDCAVTGNVPSMRNPFTIDEVTDRAYIENATHNQQFPHLTLPKLLPWVKPIHAWVDVDVFIPGCPPTAKTILYVLTELVEGRVPDLSDKSRFG